jgi:hypothetical protein
MPDRQDCRRLNHFGQYASKSGCDPGRRAPPPGDSRSARTQESGIFATIRERPSGNIVARQLIAMTPKTLIVLTSFLLIAPLQASAQDAGNDGATARSRECGG